MVDSGRNPWVFFHQLLLLGFVKLVWQSWKGEEEREFRGMKVDEHSDITSLPPKHSSSSMSSALSTSYSCSSDKLVNGCLLLTSRFLGMQLSLSIKAALSFSFTAFSLSLFTLAFCCSARFFCHSAFFLAISSLSTISFCVDSSPSFSSLTFFLFSFVFFPVFFILLCSFCLGFFNFCMATFLFITSSLSFAS